MTDYLREFSSAESQRQAAPSALGVAVSEMSETGKIEARLAEVSMNLGDQLSQLNEACSIAFGEISELKKEGGNALCEDHGVIGRINDLIDGIDDTLIIAKAKTVRLRDVV